MEPMGLGVGPEMGHGMETTEMGCDVEPTWVGCDVEPNCSMT